MTAVVCASADAGTVAEGLDELTPVIDSGTAVSSPLGRTQYLHRVRLIYSIDPGIRTEQYRDYGSLTVVTERH